MRDESDGPVSAYLDYNATAPIRPEALAAVVDALQAVGNASSVHHPGRDAAHRVEVARRHLADLLNCSPGRSSSRPGQPKRTISRCARLTAAMPGL
ncbi:aminotransferase class V-fold PLP-dependent enzyme [Streptomyces sp. M19]